MNVKLQSEVDKIKWWHRIDLGDGIITPGTTDSLAKLAYIDLPERLDGMKVLDLGAWDGWWSFECERRGAKQIYAVDTWGFDTGKRGFDLACKALNSKVLSYQCDAHDLLLDYLGTFDLILCLGALHHFKAPLLALERLKSVCRGKLILETHIDLTSVDSPVCAFYAKDEPKPYEDPTCLWGPNKKCVEAWLQAAGFTDIKMVGSLKKQPWSWSGNRGAWHAS